MLKPTKEITEYEKIGFKKCKGQYGKVGCYYLCVAVNCEMIFLSSDCLMIIEWEKNDPRIHKNPNCRYRDYRTALEIVVEMAIEGLVKVDY